MGKLIFHTQKRLKKDIAIWQYYTSCEPPLSFIKTPPFQSTEKMEDIFDGI